MNEKVVERLKEVMTLAGKLGWTLPSNHTSYGLMQLSEVEKCLLAMGDDAELQCMRDWAEKEPRNPAGGWKTIDPNGPLGKEFNQLMNHLFDYDTGSKKKEEKKVE